MTEPLLRVKDLKVHFPVRRGLLQRTVGHVRAVDGVDFEVAEGTTLGLVGESGCGKSTTGRAILRLIEPTSGDVRLAGRDVRALGPEQLRYARRFMQMVFQDPYASLNPRMTVFDTLAEPIRLHGLARSREEVTSEVATLMDRVGLAASYVRRYPHEFSGGQRQRIGIARALAVKPRLVVADEPVSALDVSIQAQIINLLMKLQRELALTYVFIAHDLAVVRHISTEIAVMYLGRIVERAPSDGLFAKPLHPYTQALLSAIPVPDPAVERTRTRIVLKGDVPSPLNPPSGCTFHTRCPHAFDRCKVDVPKLLSRGPNHVVACHLYDEGAPLPRDGTEGPLPSDGPEAPTSSEASLTSSKGSPPPGDATSPLSSNATAAQVPREESPLPGAPSPSAPPPSGAPPSTAGPVSLPASQRLTTLGADPVSPTRTDPGGDPGSDAGREGSAEVPPDADRADTHDDTRTDP